MEPLKTYKAKLQTAYCAGNGLPNKGARCPICEKLTDMDLSEIQAKIVSLAGSIAGKSGKGKSKARTKSHYQRIAKLRWEKTKLSKKANSQSLKNKKSQNET